MYGSEARKQTTQTATATRSGAKRVHRCGRFKKRCSVNSTTWSRSRFLIVCELIKSTTHFSKSWNSPNCLEISAIHFTKQHHFRLEIFLWDWIVQTTQPEDFHGSFFPNRNCKEERWVVLVENYKHVDYRQFFPVTVSRFPSYKAS